MVVTTMTTLVEKFNKKNTKLYRETKSFYTTTRIYKCDVNIVYLIRNKVYLGGGYILAHERDLEKQLQSNNCDDVQFTYKPTLIHTFKDKKEKELFTELLNHEKEVFGNVKITSSYKTWIQNDLPYQLSVLNSEHYYQYEVRGIDVYLNVNKINNGVIVNVFFDNYDVEEHQIYFVDEDPVANNWESFNELSEWGNYCGLADIRLDHRTIRI